MTEKRLDGLLSLADVAGDAPLGDPDEEGLTELRELGKALTNGLFQSLRILAIHSSDNEAVREPLRRLVKALTVLLAQASSVHFITVEGQIYLNDLRIKMEASAYSNVVYLVTQLDKHGIGGITFSRVLNESELKLLVNLILRTKPPEDPEADRLDHIREALVATELDGVSLDRPYYFKSGEGAAVAGEGEEAQQERSALSYAKGVLAVKDYFRAVEAAEAANPLRIRKIVHDLVDVSEDEPENFLKLHTIHGVEDAYYNHCVNVATLAVTVGRTLGLTRVELADLGAAAMFHDLGYAAIERQEREEGREFSAADRMRLHTVAGFRSLLKQAEYGPGLLRRLLVTLEHHMNWKRPGGYPSLGRKSLSVFTRIVQVADHYDALVTPAAGKSGLLPVKALERIVAGAGIQFDPVVVRALVQVLGRYPYGSLVKLTSGEIGVVTSGGRDEDRFSRPTVMVVRSGDGKAVPAHAIDLAEPDILRRRIASVLDPQDSDLTPHAVLFDQLDVEREAVEAPTASTSFDSESWNRAIWEGDDVEELITGSMPTIPDSLPEPKHTSPPPPPPSSPPSSRTSGGQAITPGAPGALESTAEWDDTGVAREIAAVWDEDPVSEEEEGVLLGPPETPPGDGKEDVLAWLDAAIEASQPAMPSVQDEHLEARSAAEPSVEFTFDFGDEGAAESPPGPEGTSAPQVRVLSPPPPLPAATAPRATSPPPPVRSPARSAPPPAPPTRKAPVPPPAPPRPASDLPQPDEGLVIESPPDTWEEAEIERALTDIASSPDSSPPTESERSRLIGEAFAEGGEAAVMDLMERWGKGL